MLYDGRGYLRQANATLTPPGDFINVIPVYSSEGVLYARTEQRQWSGGTAANGEDDPTATSVSTDTTQLFYFGGRPVAQLTSGSELLHLTTDHLGTPVLATDAAGSVAWAGSLEPFGANWTAAVNNPDPEDPPAPPPTTMLPASKVFLRYPGQWVSDAFRATSTQQDVYYNVHRWYEPQTGRYSSPDPEWSDTVMFAARSRMALGPYLYGEVQPLANVDPLGLVTFHYGRRCRNLQPDLFQALQDAAADAARHAPSTPQCAARPRENVHISCHSCRSLHGPNCGTTVGSRVCINMVLGGPGGGCNQGPTCLASTVLHELVHTCGGSEPESYACERRFYPAPGCRNTTPDEYKPPECSYPCG